MLYVFLATWVACLCGAMLYLKKKKQKGDKTQRATAAHQAKSLKTEKQFQFLSENFLTRKTFRKVVSQLSALSIYEHDAVKHISVQYFTHAVAISTAAAVLVFIVFQDVTALILGCLLAIVLFHTLIVRRLDKIYFEVLQEFSRILSFLSDAYTLTGNIPDAVNACSRGKYLQQSLGKIYLILTSTDSEELLEEYYRTVPFPMLQTLAGVCYLLNDVGDEKDDRGISCFKATITLLRSECDLEVRKLLKQRLMFSALEFLPLAAIPFMVVVSTMLSSSIPGTTTVYNGVVGYIAQTVVLLVSMGAFWYIANVNSPTGARQNDRGELVDNLMSWGPLAYLVSNIIPKTFKTKLKLERLLKAALSSKDMPYIYASKILISGGVFVASVFFLIVFTFMAKDAVYNNLQSTSFTVSKLTVAEEALWYAFDSNILAKDTVPTSSSLQADIRLYFPSMTSTNVSAHAERIIQKYNSYHSLYFHWWYILIAYALASASWFVPEALLNMRKRALVSEAEEDVMQLQTMLAILRYTSLDTMQALYWLGKQSRIYKHVINFAYHEYASNPELAVERLRGRSTLPIFQQICERLLTTISKVTIREAFADLEAEKDHILHIRESVQNNALQKRMGVCSPVSLAPMFCVLLGFAVVPVMIVAVMEFTKIAESLGV